MGCGPAFTIRFDEPLRAAGSYEIVGVSEGGESRCHYELPVAQANLARDCGNLYLGFDASGALASIESTPRVRSLAVSIARDGVTVAARTFSPDYSFEELNGPGCGTCASATERW
jgi:hypothetical protein